MDVLEHNGTASAATVMRCFVHLRFLITHEQQFGGEKKRGALRQEKRRATSIVTSVETMFSEAPLCEKHAEMATIVIKLPITSVIALLLSATFYTCSSDTVTL